MSKTTYIVPASLLSLLMLAGCTTIATQSDVDVVKEKVTYVESDLYATTKAVAERLEIIEKTTDERFAAMSERIDTLSKERAMLSEEISALNAEIKKLYGRIDETDFKYAEQIKAERESSQKTEFEVRRDIEGLKKTYADIITSISSLNKNLSAIQSDTMTINRSQVAIADSLNKLSGDMEKIRDRQAASEEKVGVNMTVFLDELTRQESEIVHLKARIENLQAGAEEINVKPAAPDEKEKTKTGSKTTYTVKSGDYLSKIANQFKTTVSEIKKVNNLKNNTLYIGQKLVIP
jgi:LysM repeat protein